MPANNLYRPTHRAILKGIGFNAGLGGAFGAGVAAAHPDIDINKRNLGESGALGAAVAGGSTLGMGYLLRKYPGLAKKILDRGQQAMKKQGSLERQPVANYVDAIRR